MPVHYGSAALNVQTISSPLGTQIPQASGAAYALKHSGKKAVCVCYFGDGAASEGDFHAALNFAATLDAPAIFIVRNNGYAISTPVRDQYRGDGIAARGPGYGVSTVRVDGNDLFAVYNAAKWAREYALEHSRPVLIETMTYRVGHHSTSDDSSRYRSQDEIDWWRGHQDPITRLRRHLASRGLFSDEMDAALVKDLRTDVISHIRTAARMKKPPVSEMFLDIYDKPTPALLEQEMELHAHLRRHPEEYKSVLSAHEGGFE